MSLGTLVLEHTRRVFCGTEAVFGAGKATILVAADAVRHYSVETPLCKRRRVTNAEVVGNRGGKKAGRGRFEAQPWKLSMPLIGSGAAATPPDFADLLKCGGFTETIGASVVYSRTAIPATAGWLAIVNSDGSMATYLAGLITKKLALPDLGTDNAKLDLEGQAAKGAVIYQTMVGTGGITSIAVSLPLAAKNGWVIRGTKPVIAVTEGANTELMQVSAVDQTVTPPVATVVRDFGATGAFAFTVAATVKAYCPAATVTTEVPIEERLGSFTINDGGGAEARTFIKAGVEINCGVELLDPPGLSEFIEGMQPVRYGDDGARVNCDFLYTAGASGVAYLHECSDRNVDCDLVLTVGAVAGNRMVLDADTCEVVDVNAPAIAQGQRKGTAIFGPYNSATGADLTLTFN